jgi:hypothetical protein
MTRSLLFVSIIALVVAAPLLAQQPAQPQPGQNAPRQSDQPAVRTYEGELTKVDTTAKTITLKGTAPDKDMVFSYDDQTEVVGSTGGVQGLTGKTGSSLKISYRDERGANRATKIEMQPKK